MFITIPYIPVYSIPSLPEHQLWDTTQKSFRGRTVCPWSITNLTTNTDSVILIANHQFRCICLNAEQNWHSFMYVLVLVEITMVVLSNEGGVNGIRWSNIWFSSESAIRSVCPNLTHFIPTSLPQFQLSKSGKWRHPSVRHSVSLVNIFPPLQLLLDSDPIRETLPQICRIIVRENGLDVCCAFESNSMDRVVFSHQIHFCHALISTQTQ